MSLPNAAAVALLAGSTLGVGAASAGASTAGLVGAWSFDEGSGTTIADASGHGNAGALTGAEWTKGKHGFALSFDGRKSFVKVPHASALRFARGMTIDAWVRPAALDGGWRTIVSKPGSRKSVAFGLFTSARKARASVATRSVATRSALAVGRWTHLAATWDGKVQRLYVDGKRVGSARYDGSGLEAKSPLTIGGASTAGKDFRGQIDDVRVYDRAISAKQITQDAKLPVIGTLPLPGSSSGDGSKHPVGGGSATPPAGGGGSTTTPPASGGGTTTTPPTSGGGTSTPVSTGYPACTQTVSSASAATSAASSAAAGAVICLADGTYGAMTFNTNKSKQTTIRAANPGKVQVGNITTTGSYLTFMGLKFVNGDLQLQPPAHQIVIQRNSFTGGGFAVDMASSDAYISDVIIRQNKMVGPFGEDAIRANRYHDADGDGIGLLVEGNELTNVVQQGGSNAPHADLLQSVWGGDHIVFRKNYAHDNRAENFFIKDQPSTVTGVTVEDNLLVRNGVAASGAGQPSIVNLYGPMTELTVRRNTIWDTQGSSPIAWQGSNWGTIDWDHNLLYSAWGSGSGGSWTLNNNTYCNWTGTLPAAGSGSTKDCAPKFTDASKDDYRLSGSDRGVDWRPADQVYGP
jgi:hypothetical protein